MSESRQLALLASYRSDLQRYARDCLHIRDKEGKVHAFPGFNSAQRYVHSMLEQQLAETGMVRAVILKGRQQGISTYTAIRYYRKSALHRGVNVYILAHEQSAADSLFKIVDRFQTHNPLRPNVGISNAKELVFDRLDSSYTVATAGQKAGGRSKTTSLFHGSEVAFWQSAQDHFASSVQTVPMAPGTEVILESTANGTGGEFYERWHAAVAGEGLYIPIFVPWFWQEEYTRPPSPDFELSDDAGVTGLSEKEYAKLFNLTDAQMMWRRLKIAELRSQHLFDQEYPASPEMAFQSADTSKSFILPVNVLRARKRPAGHGAGPLIVGVDPSGPGKDRFSVAWRRGMEVTRIESRQMPETPEAVEWLKSILMDDKPDRMFVDLGNIGHAIVSLLRGLPDPYAPIVRAALRGVNFGSTSQFKMARPKVPGPKNRRAEMWDRSREWLEHEDGARVPDRDALQADASGPRKKPLINGDFLLTSKEEMKRLGIRSPDEWDAVALTFAEEGVTVSGRGRSRGSERSRAGEIGGDQSPAATVPPPDTARIAGPNAWMA